MPVSDLQFANSKHRYTSPLTGERLISVTTVVGCYDSGDKLGAGAGAATKIMREGGDYRKEWKEKRELGTRVHGYAQRWANGEWADILLQDQGHMNAMRAFCDAKKPVWMYVERDVIHTKLGYGGRFDLIGYWDGLYHLVDLKTGKPYAVELEMQLAGYAGAEWMIVYNSEGKAVDLELMPHIDVWEGLYLSGDGTAKLVEVAKPADSITALAEREIERLRLQQEAIASFNSLLHVKQWANNRKGI